MARYKNPNWNSDDSVQMKQTKIYAESTGDNQTCIRNYIGVSLDEQAQGMIQLHKRKNQIILIDNGTLLNSMGAPHLKLRRLCNRKKGKR